MEWLLTFGAVNQPFHGCDGGPDCGECVEADGLSLAGFQDGEVGLSDADASGQNIAIATLTPQKMWLA